MGNCLDQWRVRSGATGGRFGNQGNQHGRLRPEAFWSAVLKTLLVIGGVETNPGPKNTRRYKMESDAQASKDLKELRQENKRLMNEIKEINKSKCQLESEIIEAKKQLQQKDVQLEEIERKLQQKTEEILATRTQLEQRIKDLEKQLLPAPNTAANAASVREVIAAPAVKRSTSDEAPSSTLQKYTKLKSSADMSGELFEVKMLALLFLRGINENYEFFIASNFQAAGLFDDIVFRYRQTGGDGEWRTTFVQLKHKQRQQVTMSHLLSLSNKGDFSLKKYCASYAQIKERYGSEKELQGLGEFDKFEFVLYTNAPVDKSIQQKNKSKESSGKNTSLLSTGSNGVIVSLLDKQVLMKSLKEIVDFKSLLEGYTRATSDDERKQTEGRLNLFKVTHYKENTELYNKCKNLSVNSESVEKNLKDVETIPNLGLCKEFLGKFSMFTSQAKEDELEVILKDEIVRSFHIIKEEEKEIKRLFNDIFEAIKTWWQCSTIYLTENAQFWKEIQIGWIKHLSSLKHEEMLSFGITFRPGACDIIRNILPDAGILNIVVSGKTTSLSALKVHQSLSRLLDRACIFVGLQALLRDQDTILWAWQQKWCFALVIESEPGATSGDLQKLAARLQSAIDKVSDVLVILVTTSDDALAGYLKSDLLNYDEYNDECRWNDLSEESHTSLLERTVSFQGQIVPLKFLVGEEERLTRQVKGDALNKLIKDQFTFGLDLDFRIKYYIPRKLNGSGRIVDINSHSKVKSRAVLLVAEPGMGKSTLLTHLAKTAKDDEPAKWIVRINLLDCSPYLKSMECRSMDYKSTIEFMKYFCLNDRSSKSLEEAFFEHCLMVSGQMIVFIDAFDEICPDYKIEVCSIIRNLLVTKIETLWITSRLGEKDELEQTTKVPSFTLESFTKQDQQNFLRLFWKERFATMEDKKLADFTYKVLQLAEDAFKGENLVISIPQQTRMLGEFFEDNLANWQDPDARNKALLLNILRLYQHFVQKKFDHYVIEKKRESTSNVAIISDNLIIHKNFLENHTRAALLLLLTSEELSSLGVTGVQTDKFLSQISQGNEKTGIIDRINNGKPNFIHRTFAEYFAALWFGENYSNFRKFLRTKLFSERFAVVKLMFDLYLASGFELHTAVLNADHQTVNSLLLSSVDVNQSDAGGRTALHLVSAHGKTGQNSSMTQITKNLLEHGACLDKLDDVMQWRPLQYADKSSKWTVAGSMLQSGGNVDDMKDTKANMHPQVFQELTNFITNIHNQDCVSLMHSASTHGQLDVVRYLVNEDGADVNCRYSDGTTCMHKAAQAGHIEVIRYLGNKGASYMDADNKKSTPIMFAVEYNQVEVVEYLLQQKAGTPINKINEMTPDGRNICLVLSAYQGNMPLTKALIASNAEVSYANKHGTTPLHWAAYMNDVESVTYLLKKHADVNAKDKDGRTPLFKTVEVKNTKSNKSSSKVGNCRLKIVRLLLNNGGHFRAEILHKSYTILECAMKNNHTNLNSYLLHEMEIYMLNAIKYCKSGDLEKLKSCTARGVRLDEITLFKDWTTSVLHSAVQSGNLDMVNCILENIADRVSVNLIDENHNSPLHLAADNGFLDIAELLLDNEADIYSVSANGFNSLHLAVINNNLDVAKLLLRRGASVNSLNETNGCSSLHLAVKMNHLDAVQFLLRNEALVNYSRDKNNYSPLHYAAKKGFHDIADSLLDNGADINSVTADGYKPLHIAVIYKHLDVADLLLKRGASANSVNETDGYSILHMAVIRNNLDAVHCLLRNGALVNSRDKDDETPLLIAAFLGFHDIADGLLDNGADINSVCKNRNNSLHTAVSCKHLDFAKLLLKRGASVNSVNETNGASSLQMAVEINNLDAVQCLLRNGALVNSKNKEDATPLHFAANKGFHDIAALLLDNGANINSVNADGYDPLHMAVINKHLDVAELLLKKGASANSVNKTDGSSSLQMAVQINHLDAVQCLLKNGALVNSVNKNDATSLHFAVGNGFQDIAALLLDNGADINSVSEDGYNSLHVAVINKHLDVAKLLLNRGAPVNSVNETDGSNSLQMAVHKNHIEAVQCLLKNGALVNSRNKDHCTPLYSAAREGFHDIAELLLDNEADINSHTADGFNSLHVAVSNNNLDVAELLLRRGASVNSVNETNGYSSLYLAVKMNHLDAVQCLLKNGALVNSSDKEQNNPLSFAAGNGFIDIASLLLDNGADVNYVGRYGFNSLQMALGNKQLDVAKLLVKKGASVNSVDENDGSSCLHLAVEINSLDAVQCLLKNGALINSSDKNDATPLHIAASKGFHDIADLLLDNGADINSVSSNGYNPLHVTVIHKHLDVAKLLLKRGISVNSVNETNRANSLHMAVQNNHIEAVICLLKNGALVNSKCQNGETVLHFSARIGLYDITKLLLDNGADVNSVAADGYNSLHAALNNTNLNEVKLLLRNGASINSVNEINGSSSLHTAVKKNNLGAIQYLLRFGALVNSRDKDHLTPIRFAAIKGFHDIAALLLDNGADINSVCTYGFNSLHVAVINKHLDVAELLLKRGASVNSVNEASGSSSLHMAVKINHLDGIQCLLRNGAAVNFRNKDNMTPLHAAACLGYSDVASLLLDNGADVAALDRNDNLAQTMAFQNGHLELVRILVNHRYACW